MKQQKVLLESNEILVAILMGRGINARFQLSVASG